MRSADSSLHLEISECRIPDISSHIAHPASWRSATISPHVDKSNHLSAFHTCHLPCGGQAGRDAIGGKNMRNACNRKYETRLSSRGILHAKYYPSVSTVSQHADHRNFSRHNHRCWKVDHDQVVGPDRGQGMSGLTPATTDEPLAHRVGPPESSTIIGRLTKNNDARPLGDLLEVLRCPAHIASPFKVGRDTDMIVYALSYVESVAHLFT